MNYRKIARVVCLCLILVLAFYLLTKKTEKYAELSKHTLKNPNYAILFTMYNVPERQQMYEDVLNYYVNDLKFPKKNIFIVDSSGNGVNTKYVLKQNQAVFNQNNLNTPPDQLGSPTWFEFHSLFFADKTLKDLKNFDYIIKLTTKYKLPDIQKIVITDNPEILLEYRNSGNDIKQWMHGWNTEILGIKSNSFNKILNELWEVENGNLEHRLYNIKNKKDRIILPKLINKAKYKRHVGDHLGYL